MIKPAYSVSFLLSINIFVWQNVLYFLDAPRTNVAAGLIIQSGGPRLGDPFIKAKEIQARPEALTAVYRLLCSSSKLPSRWR